MVCFAALKRFWIWRRPSLIQAFRRRRPGPRWARGLVLSPNHFQTIHAARAATPAAPGAPAPGAPAPGGPAPAAPAPAAPGPAAPTQGAPQGTGRRSDAGGDTQQASAGGPGPSLGHYPAIAPQSEDEMLAGLTDPGNDAGDGLAAKPA